METIALLTQISSECSSDDVLNEVRTKLFKKGIKFNYKDSRCILYANRRNTDVTDKVIRQCNGLIVEYDCNSWEIIGYPCSQLSLNINYEDLVTNYDDYTVRPVYEGTTVLLYHWSGSWRMGTNKSFEINHIKPFGMDITYEETLRSLGLDFGALDTSLSYTVGFHHSKLHPFNLGDGKTMWLAGVYDMMGQAQTVELDMINQSTMKIHPSMEQMEDLRDGALKNYLDPIFGFILEKDNCRYLVESLLLRSIRQTWYNNVLISEIRDNDIKNRDLYVCIKNVINENATFTKLYPQFEDQIDKIKMFINELVKKTIQYTSIVEGQADKKLEYHDAFIVHRELTKHMSKTMIQSKPSIIKDFIMSNNMQMELYNMLNKNA